MCVLCCTRIKSDSVKSQRRRSNAKQARDSPDKYGNDDGGGLRALPPFEIVAILPPLFILPPFAGAAIEAAHVNAAYAHRRPTSASGAAAVDPSVYAAQRHPAQLAYLQQQQGQGQPRWSSGGEWGGDAGPAAAADAQQPRQQSPLQLRYQLSGSGASFRRSDAQLQQAAFHQQEALRRHQEAQAQLQLAAQRQQPPPLYIQQAQQSQSTRHLQLQLHLAPQSRLHPSQHPQQSPPPGPLLPPYASTAGGSGISSTPSSGLARTQSFRQPYWTPPGS